MNFLNDKITQLTSNQTFVSNMYDQHRISKLKTQEISINDTEKESSFKTGKDMKEWLTKRKCKIITNIIADTF